MVNGTSGEQPPQGVSSSPRLSSVLQPLKIQQISETRKEWTWKEFAGRTVWEWLQLLIIPIVLAVATYSFNTLQNAHSEILATDQQRQTALDTYIDRMSDLLVAGNTGKVQDFPSMSFEVRRIARARTLIVLTTLDPARKKFVVQFLFDTKLIKNNNPLKADNPIVRLDYADLNRADLSGMYLGNVDFFDVDMMNASLSFAYLRYADISQSLLQGSDLSYANLQDSNLHIDSLQGVNLRNADLSRANLAADYDRAGKLKVSANLTGANLTGAILAWANLTGAILERANLSGTNLSNTDLSGANLKGAYVLVNGKVSVSAFMSQVEQQTPRLHGTIMPDGSIHP